MSKVAGATPGTGSPVGKNPNASRVQTTPSGKADFFIKKLIDSGRRPSIELFYVDDPRIAVDRMVTRAGDIVNLNSRRASADSSKKGRRRASQI